MIVDKIAKYLSENGKSVNEEQCLEVGKMASWTFKRQFMTDEEESSKGKIRLSSCGRCPRQIAYAYHGIEKKGKEIDSRAKMVFWLGDLVEYTVVNLAQASGVRLESTGVNQLTVHIEINGVRLEGHPDGLIVLESGERVLLEIKSMSSYGYEKFKRGEIDDGYIAQVNSYMESEEFKKLNVNRCLFIAVNKEAGVMMERPLEKDPKIVEQIRKSLLSVLKSTPDNLPKAPYFPNEKGQYPWQCLYCAWWGKCHPTAQKVLIGRSYKLCQPKLKPIKEISK